MNDDDIDATYGPLLDRIVSRREEMERLIDKVSLTEEARKRFLKMAWDESVDLRQLDGPVALNHRDNCQSWLPQAGPCMCTGRNYEWDE